MMFLIKGFPKVRILRQRFNSRIKLILIKWWHLALISWNWWVLKVKIKKCFTLTKLHLNNNQTREKRVLCKSSRWPRFWETKLNLWWSPRSSKKWSFLYQTTCLTRDYWMRALRNIPNNLRSMSIISILLSNSLRGTCQPVFRFNLFRIIKITSPRPTS